MHRAQRIGRNASGFSIVFQQKIMRRTEHQFRCLSLTRFFVFFQVRISHSCGRIKNVQSILALPLRLFREVQAKQKEVV
jgi:hypothetical protein